MSRNNAVVAKAHKASSTAITAGGKSIVINISNSIESPHVKRRSQKLGGSHPVTYNAAPSVPLNFTSLNPRVFDDSALPPPEPAYNPPQIASQVPEASDDGTAFPDQSVIGSEDSQEHVHNDLMDRYYKIRYGDYRPNQYTQRKYGVDDSIPEPDHDIQQEGEVPESYRDPDVFERRNADAAAQFRNTNRGEEVKAGIRHVQTQVEDDLQAGQQPSKRDVSTLTDLGARVPTSKDVANVDTQTSYNVNPSPFPENEAESLSMGIDFAKANDQARARDNTKDTQTERFYGVDPSPFPDNEGDSLDMGIQFAKANDQARARDNTKDTQTDGPKYMDNGAQTDRPRANSFGTQTQRPTFVSQGTQYNPPASAPRIIPTPASILGKRKRQDSDDVSRKKQRVGRGRVRSEVERLNEYTRESNNAGKKATVTKNKGGR